MKNLIVVLFFLILSACASVSAIPVDDDSKIHGIRVYGSKPLLIVTSKTVEVVMVPNHNEKYALQFHSFLAHNKSDLTLKNGFVDGKINVDLDSTAAIELVRDIAKPLIDKVVGLSKEEASGAPQRFAVFSFVFDGYGNIAYLKPLITADKLIKIPAQKIAKNELLDEQTGSGSKKKTTSADIDNISG